MDLNYLINKNKEKLLRMNSPKNGVKFKGMIVDKYHPYDNNIIEIKETDFYNISDKNGVHGLFAGLEAKIINPKLELYGCGTNHSFKEIVDFCIKNRIRIIGTSLDIQYTKEREDQIKRFAMYGGIWVASAGNFDKKAVSFPASSKYTIAVSATNSEDSNGPEVDTTTDSYWSVANQKNMLNTFNGTSAAAPAIFAAASYYLFYNPNGNLFTFRNWINRNEVDDLDKVLEYTKCFGRLEEGEKFFVFPDNLIDKEVLVMNNADKIILHHSATDSGTFDSIKKYHVDRRGWKDIGYHYLITKDGVLYKGRDEKDTGAHTIGENNTSIGICLVGNFDNYKPNEKQMETLYSLLNDIFERYGKLKIYGHNNFAAKTCPGKKFPMNEVISKMYKNQEKQQVSDWAKESWEKAIKKGINDGLGPKNNVTEEQIMVFLDRLGLLD